MVRPATVPTTAACWSPLLPQLPAGHGHCHYRGLANWGRRGGVAYCGFLFLCSLTCRKTTLNVTFNLSKNVPNFISLEPYGFPSRIIQINPFRPKEKQRPEGVK